MFVKFKTAAKGRNVGDVVEYDDATAQGLIDLEIVEKTEAPKVVVDAMAESLKGLTETITKSVADGIAAATKNFSASTVQKRGHLEIPDDSEIKVENLVRYSKLKNFPNTPEGHKRAYRFGAYCMGVIASDMRAQSKGMFRWAIPRVKSLGIPMQFKNWADDVEGKTSTDKNNISAGFLVPDEFQNDLIDLRETYGVLRQNTKIVPMSSDVASTFRRRGGVLAYFEDEATASPYSDKNWDRVKLTAKKLMTLTKYSSELNEDAIINIGDDLAKEIAYAFAVKEDLCGFAGDATSTYGGITGVPQALKNISATPTSATITDVLGLFQTAASTYATLTLTDFETVQSRLPQYANGPGCKWFAHKAFFDTVMKRLAVAAGGNRIDDIQNGVPKMRFLGYDVEVTQVLPSVYASGGQIPCLFGDLSLASRLGDRREMAIAVSDQFAFDQDAFVIRGTSRFDYIVHDVGERSGATAKDQATGIAIAGPIVGLMMA